MRFAPARLFTSVSEYLAGRVRGKSVKREYRPVLEVLEDRTTPAMLFGNPVSFLGANPLAPFQLVGSNLGGTSSATAAANVGQSALFRQAAVAQAAAPATVANQAQNLFSQFFSGLERNRQGDDANNCQVANVINDLRDNVRDFVEDATETGKLDDRIEDAQELLDHLDQAGNLGLSLSGLGQLPASSLSPSLITAVALGELGLGGQGQAGGTDFGSALTSNALSFLGLTGATPTELTNALGLNSTNLGLLNSLGFGSLASSLTGTGTTGTTPGTIGLPGTTGTGLPGTIGTGLPGTTGTGALPGTVGSTTGSTPTGTIGGTTGGVLGAGGLTTGIFPTGTTGTTVGVTGSTLGTTGSLPLGATGTPPAITSGLTQGTLVLQPLTAPQNLVSGTTGTGSATLGSTAGTNLTVGTGGNTATNFVPVPGGTTTPNGVSTLSSFNTVGGTVLPVPGSPAASVGTL